MQINCRTFRTHQLLIMPSCNNWSFAHYIRFSNTYQWCFTTICSRLYIFLPCCNFLFYNSIAFTMGLTSLNKHRFLLLEKYWSHSLMTIVTPVTIKCFSGLNAAWIAGIYRWFDYPFFNYPHNFYPSLPCITESSLYHIDFFTVCNFKIYCRGICFIFLSLKARKDIMCYKIYVYIKK
jgi:hypothetical protein